MSEHPNKHVFIPPQPTESERLAWHVANSTTQHAKHLQEALTAAQQRVAELERSIEGLAQFNAKLLDEQRDANERLTAENAKLRRLVDRHDRDYLAVQKQVDRLRELLRVCKNRLHRFPQLCKEIRAELAKGE